MIVLEKNVKNLLSQELTVEQRGLIITAMLCKEIIPAVTEAKFKLFVDYKTFARDLVYLHEKGYIQWSKYKYYKNKFAKEKENPTIHKVISFMNELYGRRFDPNKQDTVTSLTGLLKNNSEEDIKLVIANRYEEWKDDSVMKVHLNPSTIFRKKNFEKYLNEAQHTGKGSGITKAVELGLKEGDEINGENVSQFTENDLYTFKTYQTDSNGNRKGNGKLDTKYGKDLKKMVNVQENLKNMTGIPTLIYIFVKR